MNDAELIAKAMRETSARLSLQHHTTGVEAALRAVADAIERALADRVQSADVEVRHD